MLSRKGFIGFSIALIAASSLGAIGLASQQTARADCPGKIKCPLTGELVCRDQCPAIDQQRADCPGRIECPISGELVCKDRCPVQNSAEQAEAVDKTPACCKGPVSSPE